MYVMTNGMMMIPGKFKPADWRLEACVSTRPTKSNGVQSADVPSRRQKGTRLFGAERPSDRSARRGAARPRRVHLDLVLEASQPDRRADRRAQPNRPDCGRASVRPWGAWAPPRGRAPHTKSARGGGAATGTPQNPSERTGPQIRRIN